jgi:serine protease Do
MLDKPRGFYVTGIDPSGPAARAGMHLGAVLLSFNGQNLTTAEQLQQLLTKNPAGITAHIDVWYLMKKTTVTVSL